MASQDKSINYADEKVDHQEQFQFDSIADQLQTLVLETKQPDRPRIVTGFVYDDVMLKHECLWNDQHPETPDRLKQTYARCQKLGLIDRCLVLPSRYATEDDILLLHTRDYLEIIKSTASMDLITLTATARKFPDIYLNEHSYECALMSLGCTLQVTEAVLKEKVTNAMAVVRPPGHHAHHDRAEGYCFFNNVAIATKLALEVYQLERILIVDWDVHPGNGTQEMFYNDPRVLLISIHRYEYGEYWPNLRQSDYDFTGAGEGDGFNVNIPLNQKGMTSSDYLAVFQQIIMPLAHEFSPQLVFISAGFDSALGCPEFQPNVVFVSSGMDCAMGDIKGEMLVEPACFAHFVHSLQSLAEGRIICILEGGYCIKSLAESAALTLRALLRDPCPLIGPTQPPCDSICATILNVIKTLTPFWDCFHYQIYDMDHPCPYADVNELPPKPGIIFDDGMADDHSLTDDLDLLTDDQKQDLDLKLDNLILSTDLSVPLHRTGFVFDPDMRGHKNEEMPSHPEGPDRISRIFEHHVESGLYRACHRIESRLAKVEELSMIHHPSYISLIGSTESCDHEELCDWQRRWNSVFVNKDSYKSACLAAGCLLNIVDSVVTHETLNGVALIRPPGHHAEAQFPMGFCFFNSVAIAAQYARTKHSLERVLIIDWDVHHGNGTQHVFYNDPNVLFISLHRFENGTFYPGSEEANYTYTGSEKGKGYTINIPWSKEKMGDAEYIAAFQQIVMPISYELDPQLVLVSAGFDAARGDPLGGYKISPEGYAHMTHMLMSLAGGRVILALEGGYNLTSISLSMGACTRVLLGEPCPPLNLSHPNNSAINTIRKVIETQKKFWRCFKFHVPIPLVCHRSEDSSNSSASVNTSNLSSTGHQQAKPNTHLQTVAKKLAKEASSSTPRYTNSKSKHPYNLRSTPQTTSEVVAQHNMDIQSECNIHNDDSSDNPNDSFSSTVFSDFAKLSIASLLDSADQPPLYSSCNFAQEAPYSGDPVGISTSSEYSTSTEPFAKDLMAPELSNSDLSFNVSIVKKPHSMSVISNSNSLDINDASFKSEDVIHHCLDQELNTDLDKVFPELSGHETLFNSMASKNPNTDIRDGTDCDIEIKTKHVDTSVPLSLCKEKDLLTFDQKTELSIQNCDRSNNAPVPGDNESVKTASKLSDNKTQQHVSSKMAKTKAAPDDNDDHLRLPKPLNSHNDPNGNSVDENSSKIADSKVAHGANALAFNKSVNQPELTHEVEGACGGSDAIFFGYLQEGEEGMFAVQPLPWCPHLSTIPDIPPPYIDVKEPCYECYHVGENWICLVCHKVACSRYVKEHMVQHGASSGHDIVLSFSDISVWCYTCDSYIDNPVLNAVKALVCESKFAT